MEGQQRRQSAPAAAKGGRKEITTDPVKAEGILASVSRRNKDAARLWPQRWGFYTKMHEIKEEEAMKLGFTREEYRAAIESLSGKIEPKTYPDVEVAPSPTPVPPTTSRMIGRRAQCSLERYERLVKTARDYPIHPPLKPGQVYDPYKQTIFFLGSVEGDPISYKLPPEINEVTDEMWAQPQQLTVTQFNEEVLNAALRSAHLKSW